MNLSMLMLGVAAGMSFFVDAAASKELKYGPTKHFVIKEGACSFYNPDKPGINSREEEAKLGSQYKLCTAIAEQSQSTERSELYDKLQGALGVCEYPADVKSLTDYQTYGKVVPLKGPSEWTNQDLATIGVYHIDCGANVDARGSVGNPAYGSVIIMQTVEEMGRGIIPAIRRNKTETAEVDHLMIERGERAKERAERDRLMAADGYTRMALSKIKLDARQHLGEKVVTSGYMYIIRNDTGLIMTSKSDTNFVAVDIANASRDFRQKALSQCSSNYELCQIEIKGTLDAKGETIIIRAD